MRGLPHPPRRAGVAPGAGTVACPANVSMNLSWDHCAGDGRLVDRTFACDTNGGQAEFVGSIVVLDGVERDSLVDIVAFVDVTPAAPILPRLWSTYGNGCRLNALLPDWSGLSGASRCMPWFGDGTPRGPARRSRAGPRVSRRCAYPAFEVSPGLTVPASRSAW